MRTFDLDIECRVKSVCRKLEVERATNNVLTKASVRWRQAVVGPRTSKIREDALLSGSRSRGDHRPFTAISVILQHAAILNTYCRVEAYEHEPYGGKEDEEERERETRREENAMLWRNDASYIRARERRKREDGVTKTGTKKNIE
ncbi:unnamed protein product [Lasius platythorax]|uniref:Uncharacterized protein n=1 Tax=Lasius platythorax TaxID=488582 RepID=A0AAV2NVN2_9HYME